MSNARWDEEVARHPVDRVEDGEIPDALLLKEFDEPPPRAALLVL
jgi:hypothetical protein